MKMLIKNIQNCGGVSSCKDKMIFGLKSTHKTLPKKGRHLLMRNYFRVDRKAIRMPARDSQDQNRDRAKATVF
jgi:hypothetical protein